MVAKKPGGEEMVQYESQINSEWQFKSRDTQSVLTAPGKSWRSAHKLQACDVLMTYKHQAQNFQPLMCLDSYPSRSDIRGIEPKFTLQRDKDREHKGRRTGSGQTAWPPESVRLHEETEDTETA